MNSLVLAYLGDAVYELYIRKCLIDKGICKVNNLQKEAIKYVSAKAQAIFIKKMLEDNFLSESEINIYLNGRNQKSHSSPKNTDIVTYRCATGFESLIGYLELNDKKRLEEIIDYIIKE